MKRLGDSGKVSCTTPMSTMCITLPHAPRAYPPITNPPHSVSRKFDAAKRVVDAGFQNQRSGGEHGLAVSPVHTEQVTIVAA